MIRVAGPSDLGAVSDLESSCLGQDAWSPALIAEGIAGALPTVSYLVATDDDGSIVGHAVVSIAGDIAELQRIAVAGASRRAGYASQLLAEVVRTSRRGGSDRLLLEVRTDNRAALSFYAARGFVEIDRRPRYYRDGADAVVMRLPLVKGCG
ncbi:MAG TPA: ribosomal protein S18-alanine N-acetyltransferase [Marmoricola sp.]